MAFVNELIGDQDKGLIDWNRFAWSSRSGTHRPWKWTIDRHRNAFLIMLAAEGREGAHPEHYAFQWKGHIARFSAKRTGGGPFGLKSDFHWTVFDLSVPERLVPERLELLSLIREAIEAHGSIYDRTHIKDVYVDFS